MNASAMPEAAPSPGLLEDVDNEYVVKTQLLRAALELEVIPAVAAGCHDVDAVARATGASASGTRVLLEGLVALGLLRWTEAGYEPTATASTYVDPASPAYCADIYLRDLQCWDHFTETIRTGEVRMDFASGAEADRLWASYAAQQLGTWPADLPVLRERWTALDVTRAVSPGLRVLDVGCGSALAALVLALDDPMVRVTGIDRAAVIAVARRLAEALGVVPQASFLAGDLSTMADLAGPYDLVTFGHIFHFLAPAEIGACLREARRLLADAGRVVIREVFATPGDYTSPDPYLVAAWLFNVAPRGRLYSVAEFTVFLRDAGFGSARRLEGTPWLLAAVPG